MPISKSDDCIEGACEACTTRWCEHFCHDDDRTDDDRHERESSEDDHILFG